MSIREIVEAQNGPQSRWLQIGEDADELPSQLGPIGYSCPVCGKVHLTMQAAIRCRDQKYDTGGLEIGDIVIVPAAYHNHCHRATDPWCAFVIPADPDSESHFDHTPKNVPYFVVTAMHSQRGDEHRCLVTLANIYTDDYGNRTIRAGWNPANGDGHYKMFKPGQQVDDDYWRGECGNLIANAEPSKTLQLEAFELAAIGFSTRTLL